MFRKKSAFLGMVMLALAAGIFLAVIFPAGILVLILAAVIGFIGHCLVK